jgi:hypothetical protein
VIVVFVMDRQFVKLFAGKFPPAPGANPRQDLQRSISVKIAPLFPQFPRLGKNMLQLAAI